MTNETVTKNIRAQLRNNNRTVLKTRTVILQVIHRDFPSLQEGSSNILNECISL